MKYVFSILLLFVCLAAAAMAGTRDTGQAAQVPISLSERAARVKQQVEKIGTAHKITVILNDGTERYGSVAQTDDQSFQIVEVDQKQKLTFQFEEVKKVRANYGGRGFGGRRPNPVWGRVVGITLIGGLAILAVLAAGS